MRTMHLIGFAVLLTLVCTTTSVFAGWTVTYLHPQGSNSSQVLGISGEQQVGCVEVEEWTQHAGLWNGSATSWVDLNPAVSTYSRSYGVSNGRQVGYVQTGYVSHACIWSGTADSMVDLSPIGSRSSRARAISGGQQVGHANFGAVYDHAMLWTGTAESFVDLNPAGSQGSEAFGVSDGYQVGMALFGNGYAHAGLWSGSAASWVDLHPTGMVRSYSYAVSDGQQVGSVMGTSFYIHAALWSGTASSFVDLNPRGFERSGVSAVSHGYQAGGADSFAGIWKGSADSWISLHSFLDPVYLQSQASSIEVTDKDIWVAGTAYNSVTGDHEAIVWHNVVPEPSSFLALRSGLLALGGLIRRRRQTDSLD